MKKASITEAESQLSALIVGLKGGSPVLIVDRGRPVARLEAITGGDEDEPDGRLSRLVRAGAVRSGRAPLARKLLASPPRHAKDNASAVAALIAERRNGR